MNLIYFAISRICRSFLFLILTVLIGSHASCSGSSGDHSTASGKNQTRINQYRKPPSSFSDTVTIDFPAAVFFKADSLQLEQIKSMTDTMVFKSNMHDCYYQMRNARIVLKNHYPKIRIEAVTNARYILFKKRGGGQQTIDLNTKNDPFGLFIFDGQKAPELVDMTNIDTQLGFYFSK